MRLSLLVLFCLAATSAAATVETNSPTPGFGAASQIVLPNDGDGYAKLVARAAAGDTSVDFRALRMAYLTSVARKRAGDTDALRKMLFDAVKAGNNTGVRDAATKLLSADYTNLYGQKFLRQACEQLGDAACANQSHFVEFGLLLSITRTGDGKTCKTGWEVAKVEEEYFVLAMLGATVQQQALVQNCDLMSVMDKNGSLISYFFRIDAVMEDEMRMFK